MSTYTYEGLTQQVEAYITTQRAAAAQLAEADRSPFMASAFGAYSYWFRVTWDEQGEIHVQNVRRLRALVTPRTGD